MKQPKLTVETMAELEKLGAVKSTGKKYTQAELDHYVNNPIQAENKKSKKTIGSTLTPDQQKELAQYKEDLNNDYTTITSSLTTIEKAGKDTIAAALRAGSTLLKVQTLLKSERTFTQWIKANCKFSAPTAYRYLELKVKDANENFAETCKSLREAYVKTGAVKTAKKKSTGNSMPSDTAMTKAKGIAYPTETTETERTPIETFLVGIKEIHTEFRAMMLSEKVDEGIYEQTKSLWEDVSSFHATVDASDLPDPAAAVNAAEAKTKKVSHMK